MGRIEIEPCVELGRGGPKWERNGIGGKYGMEWELELVVDIVMTVTEQIIPRSVLYRTWESE